MRWVVSAHNICFTNRVHASFFAHGKSIPVVRGDGVRQPGMEFCLSRLREGQWVHVYPEGKVNTSPSSTALLPLRWGVGRMAEEAYPAVVVLPMYHLGMSEVLPSRKPYFPRAGRRVTVCVGEPLPVGHLLQRMRQEGRGKEEMWAEITAMVADELGRLRIQADIHHARFTYRGGD